MLTRKLTRRITQALTRKPTEPGSGGAALTALGGLASSSYTAGVVRATASITLEAEHA